MTLGPIGLITQILPNKERNHEETAYYWFDYFDHF